MSSLTAEPAFWKCLQEIACERDTTVTQLVNDINERRAHANLSSAVRIFVLEHYRSKWVAPKHDASLPISGF